MLLPIVFEFYLNASKLETLGCFSRNKLICLKTVKAHNMGFLDIYKLSQSGMEMKKVYLTIRIPKGAQ